MLHRSRIASTCLFLTLLTTAPQANAADVLWINATGGNWSAAANWSSGSPPGPGDTAVFNSLGAPYSVIVDGTLSVAGLAINSSNITLTIQGNSTRGAAWLTVASGFTNRGVIELTDAASSYGATLTVTNGSLSNQAG